MEKIILLVKETERLDKFLFTSCQEEFDFSRSYLQKLITDNLVEVNGEVKPARYKLKPQDEVKLLIPEIKPSEIKPEKLDIPIIYEDSDIIVVNKPNDMVVHPALGNLSGTLVNGLMHQIKDLSTIGGVQRPGIVHRLDKQTTGLLVVAKTDKAHKNLTEMLKNREIRKEYLGIVQGVILENEGIIDAPIGRHPVDRKKMAVIDKNSKYAKTTFKVLERFEKATLISCVIETGRTHQIRVHFNFIKHPIVGDQVYGFLSDKKSSFGQYLHAAKLEFNHPITNKKMFFEVEPPEQFNDKIIELRKFN
ncbi:ribosomal large subunit pseudouridylate synthase D [Spiroplasma sabaudiense Ar-1343]|uniref:Pseudouridine synthase n=1 Tax=Spiroplasma sabaudiense Ar-1343 TaxID=1276257 RepID=W6AAA9_9MOLU|nr:RluA family pseudouridine synthase [Spiroplasma sabaudiense]AHI53997.1 ribosomal large subunit pseudouridylate synthase D [Spiroplasma sabaudiense Ar-1343]